MNQAGHAIFILFKNEIPLPASINSPSLPASMPVIAKLCYIVSLYKVPVSMVAIPRKAKNPTSLSGFLFFMCGHLSHNILLYLYQKQY
jgi:hypothetical protein